jgi:hypothetical protein
MSLPTPEETVYFSLPSLLRQRCPEKPSEPRREPGAHVSSYQSVVGTDTHRKNAPPPRLPRVARAGKERYPKGGTDFGVPKISRFPISRKPTTRPGRPSSLRFGAMSFLRRARKRRVVPPEVALAPDTLPEGVLPHVTPTRDVHGFVVKPAFLEAYKKNVPMFEKEEEERGARWMAFLERASGERTSPVAVTSASTSGRQALRDLRETTGIHTTGATGAHRSSSTNQFDALTQILRGKTRGASGGDAPSRERELESLVRGGIPMSLRGELWQLMLGVEETRKPGVYQTLLTRVERDDESSPAARNPCSHGKAVKYDCAECTTCLSKKTREQIAKDLPRTFPGHAQLDRPSARLALENVLLAYAGTYFQSPHSASLIAHTRLTLFFYNHSA